MDSITKIWIVLLFLTLFAFLLGWFHNINNFSVCILLITTLLKGHLVIEHFMGLSGVQLKYRFIPTMWLGTVLFFVAVTYY